jgi:hypothetical protein
VNNKVKATSKGTKRYTTFGHYNLMLSGTTTSGDVASLAVIITGLFFDIFSLLYFFFNFFSDYLTLLFF